MSCNYFRLRTSSFAGVIVSQSLGGSAHLNPAVTVFDLVSSKFNDPLKLVYIPVQLLGAMARSNYIKLH
ncbi:aquaporin [Mycoplasmopsis felis]|uniref:aquaporin n=1 Tax=Mycoplasmopsis felis TaxID=33923 RepID=UPI0021AFABF4|nr:aquaporin [Mycoplasmopsis felis]UWV79767.1 aquaporin [Mycoplasmopsis felis]WAM01017.1 aquaporin [Mycoplasmopsis felis]